MPCRIGILVLTILAFFCLLSVTATFAGSARYGYDELDRLKWTQYEDGTVISYDYDQVGNRTAKSTYMSNVTNFTITATTFGSGTIIPSGTITVPAGSSQTFVFEAQPGTCVQLIADGVPVGNVPYYTFANITANHSLTASFLLPDGDVNMDGQVDIDDARIALQVVNGIIPLTPEILAHGDVFPLVNGKPAPDGKITIDDANLILSKAMGGVSWDSSTAPAVQPCGNYPARLGRTSPVNYLSIQSAYNAAADGDTIQGNMYDHYESLRLDRNISVTLDGGYSCDYSSITGNLTIKGDMIISNGNINVIGPVVLE